jgi:hypothetical protein
MNNLKPTKTKKKFPLKKSMLVFGVFIVVTVFAIGTYKFFIKSSPNTQSGQAVATKQEETEKRVRFIATGDMIPHDAINKEAKQENGTYEYSPMYGDMKKLFDISDVRFCNQAVLGGGTEFRISGYPKFNSPTEFSRDMAELGCNVVNTGSNHVNDFSQEVITASVEAWNGLPGVQAVAGANTSEAEKQKVRYFEIKDIKFAFVSYTTYSNEPSPNGYSVTMYSDEFASKQLAEARTKADIVIASLRWGTEYSPNVNAQQKALAPKLANYGADVILGHGPHVLQPAEKITLDDGRQAIVWYSLGNFLNAQLDPPSLFNGIAVMDINSVTKKIETSEYLPVYMHYEWTPEQKASGELLTRHNFNMYTFEDGQEALEKSQNDTTFDEQKARIEQTLNKLTEIKLITKDQFIQS